MTFDGRSANNQLGGTAERRYIKKYQEMQNYYMAVVMAIDKRCAASGRALHNFAKSVFAKSSKCKYKRRFAAMSLLQYNS